MHAHDHAGGRPGGEGRRPMRQRYVGALVWPRVADPAAPLPDGQEGPTAPPAPPAHLSSESAEGLASAGAADPSVAAPSVDAPSPASRLFDRLPLWFVPLVLVGLFVAAAGSAAVS